MRQWVLGLIDERLGQRAVSRHAIVDSVDPATATARVRWDEDGTLSGPLPILQTGVGAGWSHVTLPLPGTQVFVHPDMGDMGHGVIAGAVHSTQQPPGKVTPYKATEGVPLVPGEPTFIHSSGASLRLTDGGVTEIHGTLKVDGDILASGNITDLNGVHGTLDLLRTDYNTHKHGRIQPGGAFTATTNLPTP